MALCTIATAQSRAFEELFTPAVDSGVGGLVIEATEAAVAVGGLEPGASVLVYAWRARLVENTWVEVEETERIVDDEDRDGVVGLGLDPPYGGTTFWLAVDLDRPSAAHAVTPWAAGTLDVAALLVDPQSPAGVRLLQTARKALVVWARPGVGVWRLAARDGGSGDSDGRMDGRLTVDLDELSPIAGVAERLPSSSTVAPTGLRTGDVVAVLDPATMRVFLGVGREDVP